MFSFLNRPAKDTPAEQLEYADRLREKGRLRKSGGMYRALVREWPQAPEAPAAQSGYADVLKTRGKLRKAFDHYQYLIEAYAGFFPYDQIVAKQMQIAHDFAERRRWFLFIPYKSPEDAVDMFEQLVENAPFAVGVDLLQKKIADLYLESGQYELAIEAYFTAMQRYAAGPIAEDAAYGYAAAHLGLSDKYSNSNEFRENAARSLSAFLRRYPNSVHAAGARLDLERIRLQQAETLYRQARIYERRRKKPAAALLVYERLINEFPESEWAQPARKKIARIRKKLGDMT